MEEVLYCNKRVKREGVGQMIDSGIGGKDFIKKSGGAQLWGTQQIEYEFDAKS